MNVLRCGWKLCWPGWSIRNACESNKRYIKPLLETLYCLGRSPMSTHPHNLSTLPSREWKHSPYVFLIYGEKCQTDCSFSQEFIGIYTLDLVNSDLVISEVTLTSFRSICEMYPLLWAIRKALLYKWTYNYLCLLLFKSEFDFDGGLLSPVLWL